MPGGRNGATKLILAAAAAADVASKPRIIITIRSDGEKVDDGTAALKNNANSAKGGLGFAQTGCGGTLSRGEACREAGEILPPNNTRS